VERQTEEKKRRRKKKKRRIDRSPPSSSFLPKERSLGKKGMGGDGVAHACALSKYGDGKKEGKKEKKKKKRRQGKAKKQA